jgi:plasmid stabilization system protein ParE
MTVRPPRPSANIWTDNSTALDYEIAQEKAAALGRLGRALEAALAALRDFDALPRDPSAENRQARRALVAQAGHALWLFVVQREAVGLRDARQVMRDYAVPADVQNRMGLLPKASR